MPSNPVFASSTPRWNLPFLFTAQAQKEVTLNTVSARLDCLVHCAVEGTAQTPPTNPQAGQAWLIGGQPQGEWSGLADHLACWQGGGWIYLTPADGMILFDKSMGTLRLYRAGWSLPATPAAPAGGTTVDVQARAAIQALVVALQSAGVIPAT